MPLANPAPADVLDLAWGEILLGQMGTFPEDLDGYMSAEPRAALNATWTAIAMSELVLRSQGIMPQFDPSKPLELGEGIEFITAADMRLDSGAVGRRTAAIFALSISATCRRLAEGARPAGTDAPVLNQLFAPPTTLGNPIAVLAQVVAIGTAAACVLAFFAGDKVVALKTEEARILSDERVHLAIATAEVAAGRTPTIPSYITARAEGEARSRWLLPALAGTALGVGLMLGVRKVLA